MSEYNPGFAFYDNFWKAIEPLPPDQQMEVCYCICRYGITGEMPDGNKMPIGFMATQNNKMAIDNSIIRWKKNLANANAKTDVSIAQNTIIARMIAQKKNSKEIAEYVSSKTGKVIGDSAVRKSAPWLERKNLDFYDKWGVRDWIGSCEDPCEMFTKCEQEIETDFVNNVNENVNDSQNGTGMEREISQNVNDIFTDDRF